MGFLRGREKLVIAQRSSSRRGRERKKSVLSGYATRFRYAAIACEAFCNMKVFASPGKGRFHPQREVSRETAMSTTVQQLLTSGQKLVTIQREKTAQEALALMIEHNYSQLPVVDREQKVVMEKRRRLSIVLISSNVLANSWQSVKKSKAEKGCQSFIGIGHAWCWE
jgi:CBS domain